MKAGGIVAEFNPFHAGHAALVEAVRRSGVTHIVAVMSGNYVQRGALAVAEKRVRARCALEGGVDLVLELPLPYATATAQHFARGGISLLAATGCVDTLCFGSESGDSRELARLSEAVDAPEVLEKTRQHLQKGMTFAKARQLAVEQNVGRALGEQLSSPNNALAVEYLRAAAQLGWQPELFTILRRGAGHDEDKPRHGADYASASYLRTVAADFRILERYMPLSCVNTLRDAFREGLYPADPGKLETALLARLRMLQPQELAQLPDLSEGLENRLYAAIRQAVGLEELFDLLKTKRYTHARIRRLVLHAFLGVQRRDLEEPPPYLRVLGFNHRGRELLGEMGKRASLPVSARLARLREQSLACSRFAWLEERSTDLYTLSLPTPRPCGYELRASGVYL